MFENLREALGSYQRVLVLTGYSHLLEFRSRYLAAGFVRESFADSEKDQIFDHGARPFRLPEGLEQSLLRAVSALDRQIDQTDSEDLKRIYAEKVKSLSAFRSRLFSPAREGRAP